MIDAYWFNNVPDRRSRRIDPTYSFIDYMQEVKPYHSKIVETSIFYEYTDVAWIKMSEDNIIHTSIDSDNLVPVNKCNEGWDVDYGFGYGIRWGSGFGGNPNKSVPTIPMSSLSGDIKNVVALFDGTDTAAANTITISRDGIINYKFAPYDDNGTFSIVDNNVGNIIGIDIRSNTITAEFSSLPTIEIGQVIITNASDSGKFTVDRLLIDGNVATITILENMPTDASPFGYVATLANYDDLPWWFDGMDILPVSNNWWDAHSVNAVKSIELFRDSPIHGLFSIYDGSDKIVLSRHQWYTNVLEAGPASKLFPGMSLLITDSGSNNGQYTAIAYSLDEDNNTVVSLLQPLTDSNQLGNFSAIVEHGLIVSDLCPVSSASNAQVSAYISDDVEFTFDV